MATKRKRGAGAWEFTVRRKGILPKPIYLTFDSEREGDAYVAKLEAMLDKGVVPGELVKKASALTIADLVRTYRATVKAAESTGPFFDICVKRWGAVSLGSIDYDWAEGVVSKLKEERLTPIYIGRLVRTLAAALDWAVVKKYSAALESNPLRLLPRGFSRYEVENVARERRLEPGEDEKIRALLSGDWLLMYVLALETAMRLSEVYSLEPGQVDLQRRTIFLDRTKNGDSRQVPLSTVAVAALQGFQGFGMQKSKAATARLSQYFCRVFKKAGCVDLHFHDLRAEAACRLYERTTLSDMQIARITGHRDPRILRRYARFRANDLASELW